MTLPNPFTHNNSVHDHGEPTGLGAESAAGGTASKHSAPVSKLCFGGIQGEPEPETEGLGKRSQAEGGLSVG